MTSVSGAVVWSATYNAFGKATVDGSSTVVNNLRFPGQYLDAETGLHYNWNRFYNPETGRYLRKDPIGLYGGVNVYSYALNSPLRYFDPMGLIVIYVHGTWSSGKEAFTEEFRQHISKYYNDKNEGNLNWSGRNRDCERRKAGASLAELIRDIKNGYPDEPIRIVAHSHGGNVALVASELIGTIMIDELVTLGTPIQVENYAPSKNMIVWKNVYSTGDLVQPVAGDRTDPRANNVELEKYGHSDLHTIDAWNAAFPRISQ